MKKTKGITLIALVITIVILLILAGITIQALTNQGLFEKATTSTEKYSEKSAMEKLQLELDNLVIEKHTDNKYNSETYLTNKLEQEGYIVNDNIVMADGYLFQIDREELKITDSLGKGEEIKQIELTTSVEYETNFAKAKLNIEIVYEGNITEIEINGEAIDIPEKTEGKYVIEKEILKNGKYNIKIKDDKEGYKLTSLNVTEIADDRSVSTVEEFVSFRNKVNSGANFEGKTITLMNDLDLSNVCSETIGDWEPIGTTTAFAGTFNGNGHKISEIYINNNKQKQGLFANVSRGKIENLTVEGKISAGQFLGGICANINNGILQRCINKIEIIGKATVSEYNGVVGGIVGNAYNTQLLKCINNANMTVYACSGGIVGFATASNIENCYNTGNIIGTGQYINGEIDIGGIAGSIMGNTINNCYNIGNIKTNTSYTVIGGIIGYYSYSSTTTMNRCINTGTISRAGTNATELYSGSGYSGTIIGRKYSGTANSIESITPQSFKAYTQEQLNTKLSNAYTKDIQNDDGTWKYNDGYPILKWQLPENQVTE